MISEGDQAPLFELPAVRDGEFEQVALDEYIGQEVIILAFYPGDFNPACSGETTGLDDLDLFTMQKDVSILGVSGDSVHSHRAFAQQYNLNIPLLSDVDGSVAGLYGVGVNDEEAGYLTRRAIVVIDHTGTVEYAWVATDIDDLPDVDAARKEIEGIESDETAEARYRVGHAHYMEGRRAFTSAMKTYQGKDWIVASGDFERAKEEFDKARAEFNTSVRFGEDDLSKGYFRQAERKSEALWRAAEWLSESAQAYASGEGAKATSLREDVEAPLENARDLNEPPDPDDFPPDEPVADEPAESDVAESPSYLYEDDEEVDTSLGVDIDKAAEKQAEQTAETATDESVASGGTPPDGHAAATDGRADQSAGDTTTGDGREDTRPDSESNTEEDSIGEAELEEIAAELEEQTEAAQERRAAELQEAESDKQEESGEQNEDEQHNQSDAGEGDDDAESGEIELDLADPTEETDDDDDDDTLGSGGHGVPDSL